MRTTSPSSTALAAIGGRFGPRRTTSSRANTTRTGTAEPVGQLARGDRAPANRACPRTRRRSRAATPGRHRARTTTRPARGTRARPTRSRGARHRGAATGSGSGGRSSAVVRRPCTLPRERPGLEQRLADHPREAGGLARRRRRCRGVRARRPARRGAPCRRRTPRRRAGPLAPRVAATRPRARLAVPRRPVGGARRGAPGSGATPAASVDRLVHGAPARAPAEVRGERPVEVHRARSRSCASSAAARTTMPGVQNPHCEPPVATNASASCSRTAGSRPSTVVTARPATRVDRA